MQCRYELVNYKGTMLHTFTLNCPVYLSRIRKRRLPFKGDGPVLYQARYLILNIKIQHRALEDGNEIVHELSRRDFYQEMVSVILGTNEAIKCTHTQVQKVLVRILVVQLSLQCRAHSVFRLDRLRAYLVGYL